MWINRPIFIITMMAVLIAAPPVRAEEPTDTLRARVDEFLDALNDPELTRGTHREAQRERMWDIIRRTIFFEGVARLAVGKDWKRFTNDEKRAFTDAFAELLAVSYLRVVQEGYKNESLTYLGQEMINDHKAIVNTRVIRRGLDVPVDARMVRVRGEWMIYDVRIMGMSLVKNFRAQFNHILIKQTPSQLIARMRQKIEERRTDLNRPGRARTPDSLL